jgi:dephospho-CoA kinase
MQARAQKTAGIKPIIGLCGGIGSGKSRVAAEFESAGCVVIDSDSLGRDALLDPGVVRTLREWWGDRVLAPDGRPDRRKIADLVFGDEVQRRRLEDLLHPLIAAQRASIIRSVELNSAAKAIILDSPLLFESRLDRECDAVVFVDASEPRRLQRLKQTRNWDADEVWRRQPRQWPLEEKRARSDFVLSNDGSIEQIKPQVLEILEKILARKSSRD